MHLKFKGVAALLFPLVLLTGCAAKPGDIAHSGVNPFRTAVNNTADDQDEPMGSVPNRRRSTLGMQRIESILQSGSETDRIAACEILGKMAHTQAGDLQPIEMLAKTMQSDASMEVRTAATNALGALQVDTGEDLGKLIPTDALPTTEKMGFLQRLLR